MAFLSNHHCEVSPTILGWLFYPLGHAQLVQGFKPERALHLQNRV